MFPYNIFIISIFFAIGILIPIKISLVISFVFLMIFLFLSIAIKNFMFFRIAIISLFIILGSLRMEIYKYPNIKTKDTLKLKVIVPSKGIVAIEGIGILKTNLYPSEYEVIGYIKNDSFIVISFEKVRNENVIYKKLDEFIRQNAFKFEDYAISTALLLNNREFIPFEVKNAFAQTGMYHLLAISGLHISIIFAIISFFLSIFYIPKKLNFIISTIIIFFYVLILDFIPSAFRAFLFALIFSIANLFERKVNMLNVWGLSLLINLLISPIEIYDIGFQLSYLAVLGIIYSPFNYSENYILNILKSSISAQLFTTPILLYHFSYAPILYFFANIFTIPISTLLLINLMLCLIFPFIEQLWISLHLINLFFIKSIMFLESLNLPTLKFSINSKSLFIILGLIFFIVSVWKIKFSSLNLPKLLKKKEM